MAHKIILALARSFLPAMGLLFIAWFVLSWFVVIAACRSPAGKYEISLPLSALVMSAKCERSVDGN